jgi:hypothetical protein
MFTNMPHILCNRLGEIAPSRARKIPSHSLAGKRKQQIHCIQLQRRPCLSHKGIRKPTSFAAFKVLFVEGPIKVIHTIGQLIDIIFQSNQYSNFVRQLGQRLVISQLIVVGQGHFGFTTIGVCIQIVGVNSITSLPMANSSRTCIMSTSQEVNLVNIQPAFAPVGHVARKGCFVSIVGVCINKSKLILPITRPSFVGAPRKVTDNNLTLVFEGFNCAGQSIKEVNIIHVQIQPGIHGSL